MDQVEQTLVKDLSYRQVKRFVSLFVLSSTIPTVWSTMDGDCIDDQDIEIELQFDTSLLKVRLNKNTSQKVCIATFKSNCLITNQPDWGSVEIQYQGQKIIVRLCYAT